MSVSEFRYAKALGKREIRLIKLECIGFDEAINCSLVYRALDQGVEFNALSYVWGSPTAPLREIFCDGQLCRVTKSLYQALVHIRPRWGTSLLWADALCINQSDNNEKTEQVRMMRDIYGQAALVVIWLGEGLETDKDGYDVALKLHKIVSDRERNAESSAEAMASFQDLDLEAEGLTSNILDLRWKALKHLLTREWYSRIWTIQELLMARSSVFLCGQREMRSDVMLSAAILTRLNSVLGACMGYNQAFDPNQSADLAINSANLAFLYYSMASAVSDEQRGFEILQLLGSTRQYMATDPRDKIFALVGLARDVDPLLVDYSKSVEELIINFTRAVVAKKSPLDILSFVELSSQSSRLGLPSWAPNWTCRDKLCRDLNGLVSDLDEIEVGRATFSFDNSKVRDRLVSHLFKKFPQHLSSVHPGSANPR
jgi:hypothetical protein